MRGEIQKNPVLIVANHVSWLDIPAIHCFKLAGFVAKQEIAHWPFLGWAIKQGETLFIKRGKQESRKEVLLSIQQRLQQGRSIAIFPEGKATNGDSLGNFHRQLMQAAIETQTPVQAIAIKYFDNQGKRNRVVCFKNNENFLVNVLRIISLPTSTVELTFCSTVQTQTKTAREVALITHNQVAQVLAENDYL